MNYVFISPNFPSNFKHFIINLSKVGVRVLGIGSDHYEQLDQEVKSSLAEYYYLENMEDYDQMLKACGYFTFKYGKIDRIESHNEYWLELDAKLRTDFNVYGLKNDDMQLIKYKSKMKDVFREAGIPVARGRVVQSLEDAKLLIEEVGYPVCVKPDKGVGAADTYKLKNESELNEFFHYKGDKEYIMEEFIEGNIHTFDGLVDREGKVVFTNSFIYDKGVMDTVTQNLDMYYYCNKKMPDDIKDLGLKIVKAFDLKERFFHIEFFRLNDGSLVALEVNVRPPGGLSMDMFNYSYSMDFYYQYARVVAGLEPEPNLNEQQYCAYVGIKLNEISYAHSIDEITMKYQDLLVYHGPISSIFAAAIGNYAFILKSEDIEPIMEATKFILEKNN